MFDQLGLHPHILKSLNEEGYTTPTPIQLKAIPKVLEGHDLRASAQTGTGKTAAFLLPALQLLTQPSSKGKGPRILILAPTRELAQQIATQADKYGKYLRFAKSVCIGGGVPYPVQLRKLSKPYDILIATPGRLIDLAERRKVQLSCIEMLILDEADRMLDMGFVDDVEQIVSYLPQQRQTLLFSATLKGEVLKLSQRLLQNPMDIVVNADKAKHENIEQKLHYVDNLSHKNRLLNHLLRETALHSAIVFTSTKRHADQLVEELNEKGFLAGALHGDMSQRQRNQTLQKLRQGNIQILVATDVAARGIDVQSISHVINFDLPRNIEDYVHRIGRTGRAGAKGVALSFASGRDADLVKKIETFTGQPIAVVEVPGLEPQMLSTKTRRSGGRRDHKFSSKSSRFDGKQTHHKRTVHKRILTKTRKPAAGSKV